MNNDPHKNKIETQLLRVVVSQNNGSVLARFQDWSAGKAAEDVETRLVLPRSQPRFASNRQAETRTLSVCRSGSPLIGNKVLLKTPSARTG
jgi:hypothetical protein